MKKTILLFTLCLLLILPAAWAQAEQPTLLTLYEGPKTMQTSGTASVTVNGYPLFVYDVMVNHEHIWNANTQPTTTPMAYFDFEGRVEVEIRMPGLPQPVESAAVQPYAWGIEPEVADGAVRFAWCTTFNNNWDVESPVVPQVLVRFGELKDGKIADITKYIWFKKPMPR